MNGVYLGKYLRNLCPTILIKRPLTLDSATHKLEGAIASKPISNILEYFSSHPDAKPTK